MASGAEVNGLIQKKLPRRPIQRSQVELERMTEDADAQLTELQRSLTGRFLQEGRAVANQVAAEDKLGLLFTFPNPNIIWTGPLVRYHNESRPAPQRVAEEIASIEACAGSGGYVQKKTNRYLTIHRVIRQSARWSSQCKPVRHLDSTHPIRASPRGYVT